MPLSFSLSSSFICLCLTLIKGDDKDLFIDNDLSNFLPLADDRPITRGAPLIAFSTGHDGDQPPQDENQDETR